MNINRVVMTGNLTKDPDLRSTPNGLAICKLRVACNTRRRNGAGDWEEKPNFFDVAVFGGQGERCKQYLSKGRAVAVDGRLEWREYEVEGQKRRWVPVSPTTTFRSRRQTETSKNADQVMQVG